MFRRTLFVAFVSLATVACSSSTAPASADAAPAVLAVSPAAGATGVSLTAPVVVTFSHSMMRGTEMSVILHEGSVTGPVVAGTAAWSSDRLTLTFTPAAALKPATVYVLHLAPTLAAATGQRVALGSCTGLGGQNVTGARVGGGMMGRGRQTSSGSYGMGFWFTTA